MLSLENLDAKYGELFALLGDRKSQVLAFKDCIERETSWRASQASKRSHLNVNGGWIT